ncbi:MAG: hypothetical protein GEU90_02965 [Gemmatimonas sp.]|nr:hypothetical protein [Gemmatimonas sp.]
MRISLPGAVALSALVVSGCNPFEGSREVEVEPEADAGGVEIVASSRPRGDSLHFATRVTNTLDTTAELILHGGCPVTVLAYRDGRLLWDESDGLVCEDVELPVPLAPGEVGTLSHSVHQSSLESLGDPADYQLGVRVHMAGGSGYVVEAPRRE